MRVSIGHQGWQHCAETRPDGEPEETSATLSAFFGIQRLGDRAHQQTPAAAGICEGPRRRRHRAPQNVNSC
jgi:hypothetical protein